MCVTSVNIFTAQGNLKKHNQFIHEGVTYDCDQCHHMATTQGNPTMHKKSIHESMRYYCNQCDYRYTTG